MRTLTEEQKEKRREYLKKWRLANREKDRESARKRYHANPEKDRERAKKWRLANREKDRESARKRYHANPEKKRERAKKWRLANPEKKRDYRRKIQYGEGANEHIAAQINKQDGRCGICREPFTETPCLDHNHDTGQLRGALCRGCNTGLGIYKDSITNLHSAIDYLQKWRNNEGNEAAVSNSQTAGV